MTRVRPRSSPYGAAVGAGAEGAVDPFKSIPVLVAERRNQDGAQRLRDAIRVLPQADTRMLVLGLATAPEPLVLWAYHLELDRRNVPPCLRWPANESTLQDEFITWLADLLWFTKRHPSHVPRFRGWRGLLASPPASDAWHATAARQFLFVSSRYSVAYWCANGLGLSDAQRQDLMTLPTNAMQAERRQLAAGRWTAVGELLLSHAVQHPDRSGMRRPEDVAARRMRILRTFVLSGKSAAATANYWHLLSGETMTRQAVSKQVASALSVIEDGARSA